MNTENLVKELAQVLCGWCNGTRSDIPFAHLSKAEKMAYESQAQDALAYLYPYLEKAYKSGFKDGELWSRVPGAIQHSNMDEVADYWWNRDSGAELRAKILTAKEARHD